MYKVDIHQNKPQFSEDLSRNQYFCFFVIQCILVIHNIQFEKLNGVLGPNPSDTTKYLTLSKPKSQTKQIMFLWVVATYCVCKQS